MLLWPCAFDAHYIEKEIEMDSCIVEKFKNFIDLTEDEKALLVSLEETKTHYTQGENIILKGEESRDIFVISDGWASISSSLDKNETSILDYRMSGDVAGISELSFDYSLYDLKALTDLEVCPFPKKSLSEMVRKAERLCTTFYSILSREQSILYERIISLGRRTAIEKVAHFILELSIRSLMINATHKEEFFWPFDQQSLADALGISSKQVNRSLKELRDNEYIDYSRKTLKIVDREKLQALSGFNEQFLQPPNVNWNDFS